MRELSKYAVSDVPGNIGHRRGKLVRRSGRSVAGNHPQHVLAWRADRCWMCILFDGVVAEPSVEPCFSCVTRHWFVHIGTLPADDHRPLLIVTGGDWKPRAPQADACRFEHPRAFRSASSSDRSVNPTLSSRGRLAVAVLVPTDLSSPQRHLDEADSAFGGDHQAARDRSTI